MEQFAVLGEARREIVAWWYRKTLPERIEEEKRRETEKRKWAEFEKEVREFEKAEKRKEEATDEFVLQTANGNEDVPESSSRVSACRTKGEGAKE